MYITDEQLKDTIARVLQLPDSTALPAWWDDIISKANAAAYQDVYTPLIARGFTVAQATGFDRGAEYQADIGLYWALLRGGAMGNYGDGFKGLDRRKELQTVMVTVGGVWQKPGGNVSALEATFAEIGSGEQSNDSSLFQLDPEDSRIGQVTKW